MKWMVLFLVVIAGCTFLEPAQAEQDTELDPSAEVDSSDSIESTDNSQALYFFDKSAAIVVSTVGQPIEGFTPSMYMQAFSGLIERDFDGAQAVQGVYRMDEGGLIYDHVDPTRHSAAEALTERGFETIMLRSAQRLGLEINSNNDVDELIELIS